MTEAIFKSRRDFLAGTAAAMTAATLPLPTLAASSLRHFAGRPLLVLYQPHDLHAAAFAAEFNAAGFATLALTDDPVRQWRDGLGRLVREDKLLLLGLTNWSDYTIIRGLATEERRHPLFQSRQNKHDGTGSARQHAREVLVLADADDAPLALRELSRTSQPAGASPSFFSWAL